MLPPINLITALVSPRLQYVVDFLNGHPYFPFDLVLNHKEDLECTLYYGAPGDRDHAWHVPAQQVFFLPQETSQPLFSNAYTTRQSTVYSVETIQKNEQPATQVKSWQFDVFETIFFHISRYEEVFSEQTLHNDWDMLAEQHHFLIKNKLEKIPVVDDLVRALALHFDPSFTIPGTKVCLTHDIDYLTKFRDPFRVAKSAIGHLLSHRPKSSFPNLIQDYFSVRRGRKKDPYLNACDLLSPAAVKKEIYFFVDGHHANDPPPPAKKDISEFAKKAIDRGYAIGVHPSYLSWVDKTLLHNEIKLLIQLINAPVAISRQHYLHFHLQKTPALLADLGIVQDSSLGYNQHIGFRGGTGTPYHLYDFQMERAFDLIENPLVFMDSACLIESKFNPSAFLEILSAFFTNYRAPYLTINVHNSFYADAVYWGRPICESLDLLIADPQSYLPTLP